jgi:hypothetical protein
VRVQLNASLFENCSPQYQDQYETDEEYEEQYFGYVSSTLGDSTEPENGGDDSDYEENSSPA